MDFNRAYRTYVGTRGVSGLWPGLNFQTHTALRALLAGAVLAGGIAFGGAAEAAIVPSQSGELPGITGSTMPGINIDFRDSGLWGAGHGSHSITGAISGTLDVTVTALPGEDSLLYRDNLDGFGVQDSDEFDEINGSEQISVEFTENWLLLGVFLSDLFDERTDGPGGGVPEIAIVDLYLANILLDTFEFSSTNNLQPDNENNGGFYGAIIGSGGEDGIVVDRIVFRSTIANSLTDEYSIAGLRGELSVVPLPAALPLFLTALIGLGGLVHRRGKQASATV